jgi:putative sterol carrier protein
MGFNSSAEVTKYIGGIFEAAFDDPEIGPKLAETGLVLAFDFTDPDAFIVIDTVNKAVRDGLDAGTEPPVATMSMTADTGNAYWQGKLNLPLAMAKKKITIDGNIASLLKLAPLGKKLFPRYVELLKDNGRDDLVV